ncbi:Cytochrome p450 [Globisporangium polare]
MLDIDTLTALLTTATVATAALVALLGYLALPDARERAVSHLPRPASTLPLLNNTLDVTVRYAGRFYDLLLDECIKQKGKPWRLKITGKPVMIIVSTPEEFENVLKTKFDDFGKGAMLSNLMSDILGNGVFAVDGMLWLHQRKTASHLFSLQMMRDAMEQSVVAYTHKLLKRLNTIERDSEVVNMKRLLDVFTMDVFTKIGFGVDLRGIEDDSQPPFFSAFERASGNLLTRSIEALPLWELKKKLNVGSERDMAHDIKVIDDMVYDIIAQSMSGKRAVGDGGIKDLITLFLEKEETEYANGEKVTTDPKFIRDMALNFVAAGRDTTSQSMSWFLINLNRNPRVALKIRQELSEKLPGLFDGTKPVPSMEDVQQLNYLEAALRESLRLNPVLPFASRIALRDTTLHDGTFIKEGTRVAMPHYAICRAPWVWGDDASEYKPERWIDAETGKVLQVSSFKFTAFNGGPRICLGMKFAFLEMKIAMAAVLSKFEITTERDPHAIRYRQTATMSIDGPLSVRVTKLAVAGGA